MAVTTKAGGLGGSPSTDTMHACAVAHGRASIAATQRCVKQARQRAVSAGVPRTQPQLWPCNTPMQLCVGNCGATAYPPTSALRCAPGYQDELLDAALRARYSNR